MLKEFFITICISFRHPLVQNHEKKRSPCKFEGTFLYLFTKKGANLDILTEFHRSNWKKFQAQILSQNGVLLPDKAKGDGITPSPLFPITALQTCLCQRRTGGTRNPPGHLPTGYLLQCRYRDRPALRCTHSRKRCRYSLSLIHI